MKIVYDLTWREGRWVGDTPGIYECNEPRLTALVAHIRRYFVPAYGSIRLPHPLPVDLDGIPRPSKLASIQKHLLGPLLWRNSRR